MIYQHHTADPTAATKRHDLFMMPMVTLNLPNSKKYTIINKFLRPAMLGIEPRTLGRATSFMSCLMCGLYV